MSSSPLAPRHCSRIAYLLVGDHQLVQDLVQESLADFAVSPLSLAEVLVVPARDNRLDAVSEALRDLGVRELPLPDGSAVKLALLRAGTRLKMPDCCVLLAAEQEQARVASFDDRLLDAAKKRNLVTVSG